MARTPLFNFHDSASGASRVAEHPALRLRDSERAAGVTLVNMAFDPLDPRRYGALIDGVTDDSAALQAAFLVAAVYGDMIDLPEGNMAIASASLPINVYSNTGIRGRGNLSSKITVTGTSTGHLFVGQNISNFSLRDVWLYGNSHATAFDQGSAIKFATGSGATANTGNYFIEGCRFTNFKAYYWIWLLNTSGTYLIQNMWVRRNIFESASGNCIGPASIGPASYCIGSQGQANGTVGLIRNMWVTENTADCTFIKGFAVAWESTSKHYYTKNIVIGSGTDASISDDCASYAFLVYDNSASDGGPGGAQPDYIYIDDNTIAGVRDCGIYSASANRIFTRRNIVTDQTSTAVSTLPKGGIVHNGPAYAVVSDNDFENCFRGVVVYPATGARVKIRRNSCRTMPSAAVGIDTGMTVTGTVTLLDVCDNTLECATSARGIFIRCTSAKLIARLRVRGNSVLAVTNCIEVFSDDSSVPGITVANIDDNLIEGVSASAGIVWSNLSNTATRASLSRNSFNGTWSASATLLVVTSSKGLTLKDNVFNDVTGSTPVCLNTTSAQGRIQGTQFVNVGSSNRITVTGSEELGLDTPTWTGNANDYIENVNVTEAGAGGSKYMQVAWQWDAANAAWKQLRALTGN
jgi:hypothetical protein